MRTQGSVNTLLAAIIVALVLGGAGAAAFLWRSGATVAWLDPISRSENEAVERPEDAMADMVWRLEFILCKTCSPYEPETLTQDQLVAARASFEAMLGARAREMAFDGYRTNGFFYRATNPAKDAMIGAPPKIDADGVKIRTVMGRMVDRPIVAPSSDDDLYLCAKDADCVSVQYGACDCGNGGSATAIHHRYAEYWNKTLAEKNAGLLCPSVISGDPSCGAKARCVKGACKLVP